MLSTNNHAAFMLEDLILIGHLENTEGIESPSTAQLIHYLSLKLRKQAEID